MTETTTSIRVFEGVHCDDGYDFIGAGAAAGWKSIPGWGAGGWDLGDWPLVVVLFRDRSETSLTHLATERVPYEDHRKVFERAVYVEGDITVDSFETAEERDRATDDTAMHFWTLACAPWLGAPPEDLRGPYRPSRAA